MNAIILLFKSNSLKTITNIYYCTFRYSGKKLIVFNFLQLLKLQFNTAYFDGIFL